MGGVFRPTRRTCRPVASQAGAVLMSKREARRVVGLDSTAYRLYCGVKCAPHRAEQRNVAVTINLAVIEENRAPRGPICLVEGLPLAFRQMPSETIRVGRKRVDLTECGLGSCSRYIRSRVERDHGFARLFKASFHLSSRNAGLDSIGANAQRPLHAARDGTADNDADQTVDAG